MTRRVRDALKKSSSFRTLRRLHELAKLSTLTTFTVCSPYRTSLRPQECTKRVWYCLSISRVLVESIVSGHLEWRTQNSSTARISSSEEIRHSNDPNTPRGVHLYISAKTYDSTTLYDSKTLKPGLARTGKGKGKGAFYIPKKACSCHFEPLPSLPWPLEHSGMCAWLASSV